MDRTISGHLTIKTIFVDWRGKCGLKRYLSERSQAHSHAQASHPAFAACVGNSRAQ